MEVVGFSQNDMHAINPVRATPVWEIVKRGRSQVSLECRRDPYFEILKAQTLRFREQGVKFFGMRLRV